VNAAKPHGEDLSNKTYPAITARELFCALSDKPEVMNDVAATKPKTTNSLAILLVM
jgi:hypothetical protein